MSCLIHIAWLSDGFGKMRLVPLSKSGSDIPLSFSNLAQLKGESTWLKADPGQVETDPIIFEN